MAPLQAIYKVWEYPAVRQECYGEILSTGAKNAEEPLKKWSEEATSQQKKTIQDKDKWK